MYSNVCLQLACNRAAAHMKTGAYGDALADCDAALQMDPEYTKVRVASTQWLGGWLGGWVAAASIIAARAKGACV